jgi:chemotaxis protein MotB
MYKEDKKKCEEQNFWISYADLMAGLLFVFILVVGAIVIKYVYIQEDLQVVRADLQKEKEALQMSDEALAKKKTEFQKIQNKLNLTQKERLRLAFELDKANQLYNESKEAIKKSEEKIKELASNITFYKLNEQNLTANLVEKNKKIDSLLLALEQNENQYIKLSDETTKLKADLTFKKDQIKLRADEIEKLKSLLFDYELEEKKLHETLNVTQSKLSESYNVISLKDEELAQLQEKLIVKSKIHQQLVDELNITKVKIKSLTGIRIKVVAKLKEKLGNSINIDPKSGALRFSSNILFEQGEYRLKENSKKELSGSLQKYISTLLDDEDLRANLDSIVIEGHTDTKGSYLYNLELSQKRALEVMQFLYRLDTKNQKQFRKYLVASGRSFSNVILKDGVEDRDASRRIEVKFRLKNEKAMNELVNFINER